MRVEEQSVCSPGEWLRPPVQVLICRRLGEMSIVLRLKMLLMRDVLAFDVVYPRGADDD